MQFMRYTPALALAVIGLSFGLARWTLSAQEPGKTPQIRQLPRAVQDREPAPEAGSRLRERLPAISVQEALLHPFDMPFDEDTTLAEVAEHLERALNAPVVLDLGALERQNLTPDHTIRLQLKGVRLKTALKLLLDQVGLTYKVIPEDNLLLLTDAHESDDRYLQILNELKSLHRDVHALQDSVDDILDPEGAEPKQDGNAVRIGHAVHQKSEL
jgi:hypothetical protein